MRKFFGHLSTITRHRHEVIKNCQKAGILMRGLLHDLSKYSPSEFIPGVKNYQGYRSPNARERELYGFSEAWLHHKGRNKHHFEYWTDYSEAQRKIVPIPMPKKYIAEMFCDRVAASKIYKGAEYTDSCPLEYFLGGKAHRFIDPQTSDMLEHFLTLLANEGEDTAFKAIRTWLKE